MLRRSSLPSAYPDPQCHWPEDIEASKASLIPSTTTSEACNYLTGHECNKRPALKASESRRPVTLRGRVEAGDSEGERLTPPQSHSKRTLRLRRSCYSYRHPWKGVASACRGGWIGDLSPQVSESRRPVTLRGFNFYILRFYILRFCGLYWLVNPLLREYTVFC